MFKKPILGIDMGNDQLKLALVNNGNVIKTASAQIPNGYVTDGHFTSKEAMSELLQGTMKENGIKANNAAVVLPAESIYVKNAELPIMMEEQLLYNLPFEFNDYITGDIKDYVFDYAVLSQDEEVLHLMAVAVEKTVIEDYQAMLRKAGIRLVKTAPALCAYISLIRDQREKLLAKTDEIGILDLGHEAIVMYMYKNDRHVATREFENGLFVLDDIISAKFGVEKETAHQYVLRNFQKCLESEECMDFYDNLSVELMRAINFYEFSNQGSSLEDLWICGGGAINRPLVKTIAETLEGTKLHPSHELLHNGKNIPNFNSFVQAIGITLEI